MRGSIRERFEHENRKFDVISEGIADLARGLDWHLGRGEEHARQGQKTRWEKLQKRRRTMRERFDP